MSRRRLIAAGFTAVLLVIALPAPTSGAAPGPNAVTEWATIVQSSISNDAEPRGPGSSYVLHTITQLAVYDAVTPLTVGEFEPDGGCGTQPVETKLGQVTPFTFSNPAQFRPDGPVPSASEQFAADSDEVKAYVSPAPAEQQLLPRTGSGRLLPLLAVLGLGVTGAGAVSRFAGRGGSCRSHRRGKGARRRRLGR